MAAELPRRPFPVGRRGALLLALIASAIVSSQALGLELADLVPRRGGADVARGFFAGALRPALDYQADFVPPDAPPFLWRLAGALYRTVLFAAGAMGLALAIGLALGFLGSTAWWAADPVGGRAGLRRAALRSIGPAVQVATRFVATLLRSVHELLWAVIFLAAFGLSPATCVLALAIPFGGTLAKVFSEMLDEAPTAAADALRTAGAPPLRVFLFGRLPQAAPDMAAYAFYRFECAVRSSAVLGFFGYPTVGYYLRSSFENIHYREVWTYLYALIALVLLLEWWSSAVRRRMGT